MRMSAALEENESEGSGALSQPEERDFATGRTTRCRLFRKAVSMYSPSWRLQVDQKAQECRWAILEHVQKPTHVSDQAERKVIQRECCANAAGFSRTHPKSELWPNMASGQLAKMDGRSYT